MAGSKDLMVQVMKKIILLSALLCFPLLLTGCLTPVKNELPLAPGSVFEKPSGTNDTRLVVYNDSNFALFGLDGSGRINVSVDGKGIGLIGIGKYAQVIIPKGKHQVDLVHLDLGLFPSHHDIDLTDPVSFLEIFATPTSNRAFLISDLPPNFTAKYTLISNQSPTPK
jgi:hypothetical protein